MTATQLKDFPETVTYDVPTTHAVFTSTTGGTNPDLEPILEELSTEERQRRANEVNSQRQRDREASFARVENERAKRAFAQSALISLLLRWHMSENGDSQVVERPDSLEGHPSEGARGEEAEQFRKQLGETKDLLLQYTRRNATLQDELHEARSFISFLQQDLDTYSSDRDQLLSRLPDSPTDVEPSPLASKEHQSRSVGCNREDENEQENCAVAEANNRALIAEARANWVVKRGMATIRRMKFRERATRRRARRAEERAKAAEVEVGVVEERARVAESTVERTKEQLAALSDTQTQELHSIGDTIEEILPKVENLKPERPAIGDTIKEILPEVEKPSLEQPATASTFTVSSASFVVSSCINQAVVVTSTASRLILHHVEQAVVFKSYLVSTSKQVAGLAKRKGLTQRDQAAARVVWALTKTKAGMEYQINKYVDLTEPPLEEHLKGTWHATAFKAYLFLEWLWIAAVLVGGLLILRN